MRHDDIHLIDEHVVVSCTKADATEQLADPIAVAPWFGAQHRCGRTTVGIDGSTLEFRRTAVEWHPEQWALVVDGTVGGIRYHAHLTLRSVIRIGTACDLHEATEIWAHVELASHDRAVTTARTIRSVLRRGLEHLRLELDAAADTGGTGPPYGDSRG